MGVLKTSIIGIHIVATGNDETLLLPASNRLLRSAWLSISNVSVRALYGTIMVRIGPPDESTEGIFLAEGWFGAVNTVNTALHGEGIRWQGELPLFDPRGATLLFNVRNDSGASVTYTGGQAWEES